MLLADGAEGEALGYALARVKDRPGSALEHSEVIVSLDQIAVVPDAARSGVGTALLEAVREVTRGRLPAARHRRLVLQRGRSCVLPSCGPQPNERASGSAALTSEAARPIPGSGTSDCFTSRGSSVTTTGLPSEEGGSQRGRTSGA
ncbi:GNAT family N-acetyltransferase [Streptomyces sp. B15]|uniref:GNAT family N-acetyltransferase n=1 Tax=Streptomyces sp. B15 TaxID=1537797 RepID=UPI001B3980B4|nr:GNAT family N-acetyltransferase [Streptomyces sp. B15]